MKAEAKSESPAPKRSEHPWKTQMSARKKLAAARKEGARRKRLAQYADETKDPVYRKSMTATHVQWETNKYHSDPEWAEKRREYYKQKRASARNPNPPDTHETKA